MVETNFEYVYGTGLHIVDYCNGEKQKGNDVLEIWVEQYTHEYSCDSFYGNCFVKLPNGKYLKWHYDI